MVNTVFILFLNLTYYEHFLMCFETMMFNGYIIFHPTDVPLLPKLIFYCQIFRLFMDFFV